MNETIFKIFEDAKCDSTHLLLLVLRGLRQTDCCEVKASLVYTCECLQKTSRRLLEVHLRRFCSKQNDNSPQSTGTLNFNHKLSILFLEGPCLTVQADPKLFFVASAFQVAGIIAIGHHAQQ